VSWGGCGQVMLGDSHLIAEYYSSFWFVILLYYFIILLYCYLIILFARGALITSPRLYLDILLGIDECRTRHDQRVPQGAHAQDPRLQRPT
jgi:hypothetical protein